MTVCFGRKSIQILSGYFRSNPYFWDSPPDRLLLEIDSVEKTVFLSGGFYCKLKLKQQLEYITLLIF